ncbi:hypothetical protein DYB37_004904 [Aphanomyces astaci]|uniref:Uncharacterized protein n=1 Tax=Aphanomyces astaci TaxID=112090 RepID=A0A3R6Y4G7_APHAT|nr:hypothetical protein DYB35_001610 [Aphanomyces astaci]RHZ20737.1 hypothetical protein DYB37_004904 [Aphanomyces astaci]
MWPQLGICDFRQCKAITIPYKCTPALHAMNALVCERGDLSGKNLETCRCLVIKGGRITHTWVNDHYPHVQAGTPQWNMLLQAICNSTTPRVACATGLTSHDRIYPAPVGVAAAVLVVALIA